MSCHEAPGANIFSSLSLGQRITVWLGVITITLSVLLLLFRMMFVNYVENYQLAYKFDARNGEITLLPDRGYIVTWPILVSVHTIDLRPMQVCISTVLHVLNCKLVQFNADDHEAVQTFLAWHGRRDYEGPSSSSSTSMNDSNYFRSILLNYAYDGQGRSYPFLTILRELRSEE